MNLGIKGKTADKRIARARHHIATALATHEPKRATIAVDGETVMDGEFLLVEVTSIGYVGPALELVADTPSDDGCLDVIALNPARRAEMVEWLVAPSGVPPIETRRGRRITVKSEDRFRIDDREVQTGSMVTAIDVTTGRAGLRIMIPSGGSTTGTFS